VSSSSKPESFGRSIIEALAMERPVIATRHGGALEIVREGVNGFFFAPGDVAGLAAALQAAGRQTFTGLRADILTRFALDRMIDATLAVYRELLDA
jgi:glycosyltransferase involved in cell wall biosynthesis